MTDDVGAAPDDGQAAPDGGEVTSWTDGFDDEIKGYVENKGFKDASALAESYKNLEKLRGVPEDRLLQLPSDPEQEGAMDEIFNKLGRPETPDAYSNALGDEFPADVFSGAAEAAHKLGLTDSQFKGMQEQMAQLGASITEREEAESLARFDEWKSANPDGFNNAARVMADLGLKEDDIAGILSGDKTAIYDFAAKVGARSAEGNVVMGDQPKQEGFGMSPAMAKSKIAELLADDNFNKGYMNSNKAVQKPFLERMMRLQEIAAKG